MLPGITHPPRSSPGAGRPVYPSPTIGLLARTQTIVQLNDELLAELDALRARSGNRSRSEVIGEAIESYLAARRPEDVDAAIVEGYTRMPPSEDFGALQAARASILVEPWDPAP